MKKRWTLQTVNAARLAAKEAFAASEATYNALVRRLDEDRDLANELAAVVGNIRDAVVHRNSGHVAQSKFRDQLEATANSYGFTLADHPTRKDLVVIEPMED